MCRLILSLAAILLQHQRQRRSPDCHPGQSDTDVSNINSGSLNFNGLQVRVKPNNQNQCSIQDVNGDGIPDLVCQFQDSSAGWVQGSSVGVVTGVLNDGSSIRGTDSICIVP